MIDQADKKCGLLFKQSKASKSSTLKEDIKYLSLLNASLSLTNKWTPRSYGDMSWVSFLLKMLALLHPIISDCHCIVFDRRILSAFCSQWITALGLCILFSITQMTFTGPGAPLISSLIAPLPVLCCVEEDKGRRRINCLTNTSRAQSSPHSQECGAASLRVRSQVLLVTQSDKINHPAPSTWLISEKKLL